MADEAHFPSLDLNSGLGSLATVRINLSGAADNSLTYLTFSAIKIVHSQVKKQTLQALVRLTYFKQLTHSK